MKTATQFLPLMIALFVVSIAGNVNAQGRGHHNGNERSRAGNHEKDHHKDWKHDRKEGSHHRDYDHRHDRGYSHNHDRRHEHHPAVHHRHEHRHAPVVVRHYHPRPRYIYYRDYDVYHDLDRNVYISYSGRNWSVSASLPVVLHRVDVHRAVRMEVDYDQDDFPRYLERSRPAYRRIYTGS
ncbi:MAG: hypothetical protein WA874_04770 [Chryseosolibacter sp.]